MSRAKPKALLRRRRVRQARKVAVYKRVRRLPLLRRLARAAFVRDLQRLHDVLNATELAGRYWIFGGLLLGWAREGHLIGRDISDADFAVRREDLGRLNTAIPALNQAGFRCLFRFTNNDGEVTELTFMRRGAQFEFFLLTPGDHALRYFLYGFDATGPVQALVEEADDSLVPFHFVGRTWLKPADHERELAATYGDWRARNKRWWYLDQPNIVEREPWLNDDYAWR
jgi:hypothetical protein